MQKLDDITNWVELPPKGSIKFADGDARHFRLYVNAPANSKIYITPAPDEETGEVFEPRFLANITGMDSVDWYGPAGFTIHTSDPDVWVYSLEFEQDYAVVEDPEIYTRIVERSAARNPELEYMMLLQRENERKRMAILEAKENDILRQREELERDRAASEGGAVSVEPEPNGGDEPADAGGAAKKNDG